MEEPNIQSLRELPDFPNYYIDMERREAWSLLKRGNSQHPKWKKLRVYERDGGIYFDINHKRKKTVVTFNKAVWCLKNGVSYHATALDVYCFLADGSVKERRERIKEGWKKRNNRIKQYKIQDLEHTILVLGLLKDAYEGFSKPLLRYVNDNRQSYLKTLTSSRSYQLSQDRAEIAYRMSYDRLLENIQDGNGRIYNFDRWFMKTAYGLVQKIFDEKSRYINIEKLKELI